MGVIDLIKAVIIFNQRNSSIRKTYNQNLNAQI